MSSGITKYGFTIFRWAVAIFCFTFLAYKIYNSGDSYYSALKILAYGDNTVLLIITVLLMLANWAVESLKWKIGSAVIQKINYANAVSSVMAGLAVSMAGPNRTGEFLGRITALDKPNRIKGSFVSVHISLAQTVVTIIAGLLALMIISPPLLPASFNNAVFNALLPCIMLFSLLLYYRFADFYRIFKTKPFNKWIRDAILEEIIISRKALTINLILSILRYAVFITQFVIVFRIFGISLSSSDLYLASAVIYLLMAVVPSLAIAELGIRGAVAVYIMDLFDVAATPVIAATSLLWLINIAVPAAVGAVVLALKK